MNLSAPPTNMLNLRMAFGLWLALFVLPTILVPIAFSQPATAQSGDQSEGDVPVAPGQIEGPRLEPQSNDVWNVEEPEATSPGQPQEGEAGTGNGAGNEIENDGEAGETPPDNAGADDNADGETGTASDDADTPQFQIPEVSTDLEALPFPVRRMRELILDATQTGDIEKLRALIGIGDSMTLLSLGGIDGDPIEYLKEQSGDENGYELLAILEEILQAGYAHLDPGTEQELYVWPYFFSYPLDQLTARQRVELYRIVTHGDYLDMEDFGGYIFYRVGISPSGRWQFFVAGD